MTLFRSLTLGTITTLGATLARAADEVIDAYVTDPVVADTVATMGTATRAVQIAAAILAIGILTLLVAWLMRNHKYQYEDPNIAVPDHNVTNPTFTDSERTLPTP